MTSISRLLRSLGALGAAENARRSLAEREHAERQVEALARRVAGAMSGSRPAAGTPLVRKSA